MIDVTILGAGPAGTAAAFDLLSQGFSVLLLDKTSFPRKKACAGGITPKALDLFPYDISSLIKQSCYDILIRPPRGNPFLLQDKNPLCHMTQRWELDLFSLNQVLGKGGQFQKITRIVSIEEKSRHLEIRTRDQLITSRYLIGADGANSRVRQLTLPSWGVTRYPALEADIQVNCPEPPAMEFDFSLPGKGYYWIFPKGDLINVGIYSLAGSPALKQQQLVDYVQKRFGPRPLQAIKGYPIGVGGYAHCPGKGRILLAGDAAGFGESLLGEGIYFALKSGQAAARSIVLSQVNGIPPGRIYAREIQKIRTDLRLYHLASRCLYAFPHLCLTLAFRPFFHKRFVQGYAKGKTLGQIVTGR